MNNGGYRNLSIDELVSIKENIYKDENLQISYINNNSDSVVILFAYGMITITEPPRENLSLYTLNDKNIIHIVDLKVSWFNNFTAEFILEKIQHLIDGKKVYLVGMSMGAFNAIHFSNFIKAEKCIGFGPQYSVKDPDPNRYGGNMKYYIDRLESFNVHTVNFSPDNKYVIVFGSDDEENLSSSNIINKCKAENIQALFAVFHDSPHLILDYLSKKEGPVDKIIEGFIDLNKQDLEQRYKEYSVSIFNSHQN